MSKHTLGVWVIDPHQRPEDPLAIFDGPNCGTLIASVHGDDDEEAHANACIIAAAPEMFESLRQVVVKLESFCVLYPDLMTSTDQEEIDAAYAAIRKATGD